MKTLQQAFSLRLYDSDHSAIIKDIAKPVLVQDEAPISHWSCIRGSACADF
jgi:hypothetical protein